MKRQLAGINQRFIEAVDHVITTHKEVGIDPTSSSGLSKLIGKDQNTISRVRQGMKDVSSEQVKRLALLCGLDLNFFYNEQVELHYNPELFCLENLEKSLDGQIVNLTATNSGQGSASVQLTNGDFHGDIHTMKTAEVNKSKETNKHTDTHYHFYQAEQIVRSIPVPFQHNIATELEEIKRCYFKLEQDLNTKTEDIKKMTIEYLDEIRLSRTNLTDALDQLKQERAAKDELLAKYITLVEGKLK